MKEIMHGSWKHLCLVKLLGISGFTLLILRSPLRILLLAASYHTSQRRMQHHHHHYDHGTGSELVDEISFTDERVLAYDVFFVNVRRLCFTSALNYF
jgi:hypothetical protein